MSNPVDYVTPNSLAAIWSMMLPGLGQLMKGKVMAGILWAITVASGYFAYFWPGLLFHGFCILDAAFSPGENSFMNLSSWGKRLGLLGLVAFLLTYIYIRNF